jgi:hypothetical protein
MVPHALDSLTSPHVGLCGHALLRVRFESYTRVMCELDLQESFVRSIVPISELRAGGVAALATAR